MPLNLVLAAALASIEKLINQTLSLDSASQEKVRDLEGKVVCVQSTSPRLSIYLIFHQQGLMLSSVYDRPCDATVQGTATALMTLLISRDKQKAIRQEAIQIQGDAAAIQQLQTLADTLDIDWEYQLSNMIGDIPTQLLSDGFRQLRVFLADSHEHMSANLDEYLHEESKLLPGKVELEAFYQRIDELRLRLDRFKSRLSNLEQN